jgi:hypothetical protein
LWGIDLATREIYRCDDDDDDDDDDDVNNDLVE